MSSRNLLTLKRYTYFPKELFRLQGSHLVTLRPQKPKIPQGQGSDPQHLQRERLRRAKVEVEDLEPGLVPPKGCPVMENSRHLRNFLYRWPRVKVFVVQEGTPLPDNLMLVHQGDSITWSIDPVGKQSLAELNENVTRFLSTSASIVTPQQWLKAYRKQPEDEPKIINPRGKKSRGEREVVKPLEVDNAKTVAKGLRLGSNTLIY